MQHTLTLGCTRMLAGAGLALEAGGEIVSYLSRSGRPPRQSGGTGYACEWSNESELRGAVQQAVNENGAPHRVLAWAHGSEPVFSLARALSELGHHVHLFQVLGSAAGDPSRKKELARLRADFEAIDGIEWHGIILGFKVEEGSGRWLTHEDISSGAILAIELGEACFTVGQTDPWELRP